VRSWTVNTRIVSCLYALSWSCHEARSGSVSPPSLARLLYIILSAMALSGSEASTTSPPFSPMSQPSVDTAGSETSEGAPHASYVSYRSLPGLQTPAIWETSAVSSEHSRC